MPVLKVPRSITSLDYRLANAFSPVRAVPKEEPAANAVSMKPADAMLIRDLAKSREELLEISDKVRNEINKDSNIMSQPEFVRSMLKDIAIVALGAINATVRHAAVEDRQDLVLDDCKPREGHNLPNVEIGLYENREFLVDISKISESTIGPIQRLRKALKTELKKTDADSFIFNIFEVATHEIFHSLQENRMGMKVPRIGLLVELSTANHGIFRMELVTIHQRVLREGGARFVEVYISSIVENPIDEATEAVTRNGNFFHEIKTHAISDIAYEDPNKIMHKLKRMSPYDQGLFIFSATLASNGSFTETVKGIYNYGLQGTYMDRNLYHKLRSEIVSGSVEKLRKELDDVRLSFSASTDVAPDEEHERVNDIKSISYLKRA